MIRLILLVISSLLITNSAWANFPYHPIQLPQDDRAHYENVPYPISNITEWWYYNGKLTTKNGRHFGYYLTYFYMQKNFHGHQFTLPVVQMQLTDIDNKKVYGKQVEFFDKKKFAISSEKLDLTYGTDFSLQKDKNTYLVNATIHPHKEPDVHFSLQLTPTRSPLLASKTGLIDMRNNTNSYYYSFTNLTTQGSIRIGDETLDIDPTQSLSWMDHQWGDFVLDRSYQWMWASIQLKNGLEMDLAAAVDPKTKNPIPVWANIIMPDDSRVYLTEKKDFSYTNHGVPNGLKHPVSYDLTIPSIDLKLHMNAYASGQDVTGVWEGISTVEGTYKGKPITGQATTESTVSY